MNARKFPRTLKEAFGPHTSQDIDEPHDPPMTWSDKLVLVVLFFCYVFVVWRGVLEFIS